METPTMVAVTITVETDGVTFTALGDRGPGISALRAHGPTVHAAVRGVADQLETIAQGGETADSRLLRAIRHIETDRGQPWEKIKAVQAILTDEEEA